MTGGNGHDGHAAPAAGGIWHRNHPLALVIDITERVRSLFGTIVSLLVLVAWIHPPRWVVWTLITLAVAATVLRQVVLWTRRRYRLGSDGVALRTGVFNTVVTTIPYDHIHTINVNVPVFFRPFGLAGITIDSGGISDGSSIVLTAVPARLAGELERLRARATDMTDSTAGRAVSPSAPSRSLSAPSPATGNAGAGRLVFRASTRDTVLFALTDLGFLAALAVIYGFAQNLGDLLPSGMVDEAEYAVFRYAAGSVTAAVMVAAAVLASMLVVSVIKSLLLYHRFEVWRRGDDLVIVRGLFTRRSVTIPVHRVQTIIIRRSALRRMLRLSSVQVGLTTPGSKESGDDAGTRGNVLPVIGDDRLYDTLHAMLPEWDVHEVPIRRTARGLGRYLLAMPVAWTLAAALVLTAAVTITALFRGSAGGTSLSEATFPAGNPVFGPWFHVLWLLWLLILPALGGAYACARRLLQWRTEGYAPLPDNRIVVTGSRGLAFVTMITCRSRIQYVRRRRYAWRRKAAVESMVMPLFVMNGYSRLRFSAIRSAEAQRIHDWAVGNPPQA
ncbi:PH domain-containing protein [Bifidobacterium sp. 82T24]|uniref:PH domain-containing protein n=1 Tax=Bifidobacterium pluvialisilvae TaxID=2834436 RepID=UPI001C578BF6|nr:PH domain-containing protein [Bifidobacterium pluvialisilvae]MBW3087309.1 PH domain-containing protein [Bifidobacterium pluvialisilvae]